MAHGSISANALTAKSGVDGALRLAGGNRDGSATPTAKTGNREVPKNDAWWLSEFVLKIRVTCECGLKKQYDAKALLDRIGDQSMPGLLPQIARANGCTKTENQVRDRCKLYYTDTHPSEQPLSRRPRPAIARRRPGNLRKSPSPIFRNIVTSSASASGVVAFAG